MQVTRHQSAESFLDTARPLLMMSEAENNLILGVAEGLARNPRPIAGMYFATVAAREQVLACAVYIAPFKLLLTRANRESMTALARDAFTVVPHLEGITGPARSAGDFAAAWSILSGVQPRVGMRMRIHETRKVSDPGLPAAAGAARPAIDADQDLLASWTEEFIVEAKVPEKVDCRAIVADSIKRQRLYVWDDGRPRSMAAWAGRTQNGVRINFVYTPRELRRSGYATACVSALTRQQLEQGSAFCWLYTDLSSATSPNIFKRIGYRPVSDVAEYYLTAPAS